MPTVPLSLNNLRLFLSYWFKILWCTLYIHLHVSPSLGQGFYPGLALGGAHRFSGHNLTEHGKTSI